MQSQDPRHTKRMLVVQELFANSFNGKQKHNDLTASVLNSIDKIDPIIEKTALEWPIDKLNKIDLAILRLAIYELIVDNKEPVKVIIDEAIELAKSLGSENSAPFVNGVLGTVVKTDTEKSR